MRGRLCRGGEVVVDDVVGLLAALSSGAFCSWIFVIFSPGVASFALAGVGLFGLLGARLVRNVLIHEGFTD